MAKLVVVYTIDLPADSGVDPAQAFRIDIRNRDRTRNLSEKDMRGMKIRIKIKIEIRNTMKVRI